MITVTVTTVTVTAALSKAIDKYHDFWIHVNRALAQYKDYLFRYVVSYYKDNTAMRPSHLYDGNPYTRKTVSLYSDDPRGPFSMKSEC